MSPRMARPPALVVAAQHGLRSSAAAVKLEHDEAMAVLALARHDHLTGFLAAAVMAGEVLVDDEVAGAIVSSWHEELMACVVLEALAVRTAATLDAAALRWRLTKGAALAHLDYPDPTLRTFGDVDLVVHPDDWLASLDVLRHAGMRREAEGLGDLYDRRYGKGATLTSPEELEVDLHRRLAIGRFGVTSRTEDLFQHADAVTLAGRSIPVLTSEHRLLHACYHATLGGFRRLRAFRDVAQLILVTGANWVETVESAKRWKAEAVVAAAVIETWTALGLADSEVHDWARNVKISVGDRRALRVFENERPFSAQALTALPRLPVLQVPVYLWVLGRHRVRPAGVMANGSRPDVDSSR